VISQCPLFARGSSSVAKEVDEPCPASRCHREPEAVEARSQARFDTFRPLDSWYNAAITSRRRSRHRRARWRRVTSVILYCAWLCDACLPASGGGGVLLKSVRRRASHRGMSAHTGAARPPARRRRQKQGWWALRARSPTTSRRGRNRTTSWFREWRDPRTISPSAPSRPRKRARRPRTPEGGSPRRYGSWRDRGARYITARPLHLTASVLLALLGPGQSPASRGELSPSRDASLEKRPNSCGSAASDSIASPASRSRSAGDARILFDASVSRRTRLRHLRRADDAVHCTPSRSLYRTPRGRTSGSSAWRFRPVMASASPLGAQVRHRRCQTCRPSPRRCRSAIVNSGRMPAIVRGHRLEIRAAPRTCPKIGGSACRCRQL